MLKFLQDKVRPWVTLTGTHKGPLMGYPPTGKHVSWAVILIYRIKAGMVQELWAIGELFQALDLIKQP